MKTPARWSCPRVSLRLTGTVLATLSDKDGQTRNVMWQWARVAALVADTDDDAAPPDATTDCRAVVGVGDDTIAGVTWAGIEGATSAIYTAKVATL